MSTTRPRTAAALALTATLLAAGAATASAHDGHEGSAATVAPRVLAQVRAATAVFHSSAAAIAAGYVPAAHCEPGMGQHWVNPANLMDGVHDLTKPDVLLYEPTATGVRLVGVEWIQFDADQDLATDDDRPYLAGVPFEGPMPGHEPGMPVHYDKHLYVWEHNPDGVAAVFNPRVEC